MEITMQGINTPPRGFLRDIVHFLAMRLFPTLIYVSVDLLQDL